MNWQHADPAPALLVLPADVASLDEAHAAIELWEHYTGKTLDSTQRLTVEVMMAQTADGRWAAKTTGREMPRQNGKGDELEVVELWGIVQRAEAILHTIHEAVLLATQTQERMLSVIEGNADLRRKMKRRWTGTGQQMIEMTNGGIIWYRTRSGGGGRGLDDVDRVVVDEAQHVTPEHLAATTPTGFANGNNQLNFAGTSGLPGESIEWWRVRKRALSANPGAFGYVGHTVERLSLNADGQVVSTVEGDYADERLMRQANPALGRRGAEGVAYLREQYQRLGPTLYAQEHLGVWAPEPTHASAGPVHPARWAELVDAESMAADGLLSLGLDAPAGREVAWFAVDGKRVDGLRHGAIRYGVDRSEVGRVVEIAKQLTDGHGVPLNIADKSPAVAWLDELESAGVATHVVKSTDLHRAQQAIEQDVADGTLRHRGQIDLSNAAGGLTARRSGEVSVWSRQSSTADVSPMFALAAARAGGPGEKPAEFFVY